MKKINVYEKVNFKRLSEIIKILYYISIELREMGLIRSANLVLKASENSEETIQTIAQVARDQSCDEIG